MTTTRLYELVEQQLPEHIDDEPDPSKPSRPYWQKQLQWALKDGTLSGDIIHLARSTYALATADGNRTGVSVPMDRAVAPARRTTPLEQVHAETFPVWTEEQARTHARAEAQLVTAWGAWSAKHGRSVERLVLLTGTGRRLVIDAYEADRQLIVEAKASASVVMIRLALGQLLDYSHHANEPGHRLAVLVPVRPVPDLVDVLTRHGVGLIVQAGAEFEERLEVAAPQGTRDL